MCACQPTDGFVVRHPPYHRDNQDLIFALLIRSLCGVSGCVTPVFIKAKKKMYNVSLSRETKNMIEIHVSFMLIVALKWMVYWTIQIIIPEIDTCIILNFVVKLIHYVGAYVIYAILHMNFPNFFFLTSIIHPDICAFYSLKLHDFTFKLTCLFLSSPQ